MENLDGGGEGGQSFTFKYRGSTEVDRHYSKSMLPWIISEIKNQQKSEDVRVLVKNCFNDDNDDNSNSLFICIPACYSSKGG